MSHDAALALFTLTMITTIPGVSIRKSRVILAANTLKKRKIYHIYITMGVYTKHIYTSTIINTLIIVCLCIYYLLMIQNLDLPTVNIYTV